MRLDMAVPAKQDAARSIGVRAVPVHVVDLSGQPAAPAGGNVAPAAHAPPVRTARRAASQRRPAARFAPSAERMSAALQVLKQQGRATGGVAPYGFQFIDGRRAFTNPAQFECARAVR